MSSSYTLPTLQWPSQQKGVLLIVVACLQTTFCAGIVFGWASVAGTLLVAPFDKGGANLTLEQTTSIFAAAASTAAFSSLILGFVLDLKGPRTCSVTAHIIIGFGCLVFATSESYHGFLLGACLIAFGGPGVQASVVHLANLFPDRKFLVMACISGSITLSFAVLPTFDILWEHFALGLRTSFQWYITVVTVSALSAALLYPDDPYESLDEIDGRYKEEYINGKTHHLSHAHHAKDFLTGTVSHTHLVEAPLTSFLRSNSRDKLKHHESFHQSVRAMATGNYTNLSLKDQPFCNQLVSGVYVRIMIVFVGTSLIANLFVASLPTELADLSFFTPSVQHGLARTFTLITSAGIVGSLLVGFLMDRIGLVPCTVLTLLLGLTHNAILIFCSAMMTPMLGGYIIYTMFRQFLFPVYIACLSARLGFKYFGILNGLGFAVSGAAQLFIAYVVRAVQGTCHTDIGSDCTHGRWTQLHIVQVCILSLLLVIPLLDHYAEKNQAAKASQTQQYIAIELDYGSIPEEPNDHEEAIVI